MHILFLLLSALTTVLLSTTLVTIWIAHNPLLHFYFGLTATVSCLLTHCWVFFYFIGTGQGIREGVLDHGLDQHAIKLTKKFKGKTFPFALFSMIFMIVTATTGGGVRFASVSPMSHQIWSLIAILFNLFAFWQEFRIIQKNRALMQSLNDVVQSKTEITNR